MKSRISIFILLCIFQHPLLADSFQDLLKDDFSRGQTLLIKNTVFQKIGKRSGDKDVLTITKKIIPWAILEGLPPEKVADLILKIDIAQTAGLSFEEAEDAIPPSATRDLSDEDFPYIALYLKETKLAGIREEVRNRFLEAALEKQWSGFSVLAGGRALSAGKLVDFPQNRLATRILKQFSPRGKKESFGRWEKDYKSVLDDKLEGGSYILLSNLKTVYNQGLNSKEPALGKARAIESSLNEIGQIIIGDRPKFEPVSEPPLVPNLPEPNEPSPEPSIIKQNWQTLSASMLRKVAGEWVGTPYKWAGAAKTGTDCSGFTYRALTDGRIGVPENRMSRASGAQTKLGISVTHNEMRAGDLIFFSASPNQTKVTHVGLVLSETEFAHASSSRGVIFDKVNSKWWLDRFVLSRRLFRTVID
ncbi:NlpC/P60 family protein [Leptospira broomii serovar Hurstbridge str. 5399]|uniref:NlpC/P60 family protein n=1 Tax=Leptospira broomii serovar Hurstbridge str. 5399 TaxID=1049789 RepID=T0F6W8_9LEPT|nr:C40 family peptidase [Leptospira broomii]EQA43267.1 NlpC/P60 family protein [Leptospira broomii serovar Hurstbridge str. 5399]